METPWKIEGDYARWVAFIPVVMQNVFQNRIKKALLQVNCGHTEPCIILILILIFPGNSNSFA